MAVWSEVAWSNLTDDMRLDAEYYTHPGYSLCKRFERVGVAFTDCFKRVIHPGEFKREYRDTPGHLFLRAQNVKPGTISVADALYVDDEVYQALPDAIAKEHDLLLVRTGANLADLARVTNEHVGALVSSHTLRLVPRPDAPVHALEFFFCSRMGRDLLLSLRSGGTHGQINGHALRQVALPELRAIEEPARAIAQQIVQQRAKAHDRYAEAEALLESALGLDKLDLTPRLFYERRYADVQAAARFDAEYFQPPKKVVLDTLSKMPGQPLHTQFRSVRQLWHPDRASASEHVRNYDLTDALQPFLDETVDPATRDTIASTKKKLKPGDLVVSRLRSYLKEIAVVLHSGPLPQVGSTEFIVLRPQKTAVRVEALLVYLRSRYVQTVLKWCQDGSNHPRFHEDELMNLWLPDVLHDNQDRIAAKVEASINARREAWRLLDEAKSLVEQAILGE